jgi:hypothetical protein
MSMEFGIVEAMRLGKGLDKGQAGDDAAIVRGGGGLNSHACTLSQPRYQQPSLCSRARH